MLIHIYKYGNVYRCPAATHSPGKLKFSYNLIFITLSLAYRCPNVAPPSGAVFVLNSHAKHGLVAIRKLAARGLDVTAGSSNHVNAATFSRCVTRSVAYPEPSADPDGFVDAIESELARNDYDMVLPINEATVDVVVRNAERFEPYTTVPFLPYERLLVGLDKRRTIDAAREAGIPHPATYCSDEHSIEHVESELGYPVVVKPPIGEGRRGISVCDTRDELERAAREGEATHGTVIYQEYIPNGGERGVYTLYDCDGELTGLTVQRRLRSRPPDGGASTYRETIEDPELVALASRLLESIDWRGLAMVEFRYDDRTGEPKLIEINPRLWGSLSLSTYAGVDFPYLLYRLAIGESPDPALDYEVGVRSRCLFTDALQVTQREDRLRALVEFFTPSERPCTYDIVSLEDPLSTVGQSAYYASLAYNRILETADGQHTEHELPA